MPWRSNGGLRHFATLYTQLSLHPLPLVQLLAAVRTALSFSLVLMFTRNANWTCYHCAVSVAVCVTHVLDAFYFLVQSELMNRPCGVANRLACVVYVWLITSNSYADCTATKCVDEQTRPCVLLL